MKIHHGLAALLLTFAVGATTRADPPPDAGLLGQVDAILGFCSKASPQAQQRYDEVRKTLTAGRTEKELREIAGTAEYRAAYEAVEAALKDVPPSEAEQTCAKALQTL